MTIDATVVELTGAFGLASVKVATVAVRALPSGLLDVLPETVSGASATVVVPVSVVLLPPASLIVTTGVQNRAPAGLPEPAH